MSKKVKKKKKRDKRQGYAPTLTVHDESKAIQPVHEYLCVRGPIYGPSGYARMTRNVIEGLHLAGKKFWVDALPWVVQPSIEVTDRFHAIILANMPPKDVVQKTHDLLSICLPTDLPSRPITVNTWSMTIFETTKVPDEWIKTLASPEEQNAKVPAIKGLILPCKGNLESFALAPQKKVVIPLAMDYEVFTPDGPAAELPGRSDFNILLSYAQNQRKNPEFVIKLINELDENTTVYIKTFGKGMSTWERKTIIEDIRSKINTRCNVVLLYDMISDEAQAEMYRAMDLIVNVAHGEGWDLPRCEAYSCGIPAIGPMFIGPDDYTIDEFRMINHTLVPCPEIPPFFSSSAKWADLDIIEYLQAIELIRSNREKYRDLALKQRDHLMKHTGDFQMFGERIWKAVMG
jgi:glycosyltransferase involved in cell wall biosynthesis